MSRTTIFIAGYYGFRNLGDEAVLSAMLDQLRQRIGDASYIITSGDPERTVAQHGVEAIHWQDVGAMIDAVRGSDLVIIGGGGLFHDYWGANSPGVLSRYHYGISFCATPAVLASLHEKPLMIYSVGVGPLDSAEGRAMTRAIFGLARTVTVRDLESRFEIESIGHSGDRVHVTADPAFATPAPGPDDQAEAARLIGRSGDGPLLAVCLRGWEIETDQSRWLASVAEAIASWATPRGARVVAIPFSDLEEEGSDDSAVARELAEAMPIEVPVTVVKAPRSAVAARALLGCCDLVLGMRLHSILLAAVEGVPAVALAYDPKVSRLMTDLGAEKWCVLLSEVAASDIEDRLAELQENAASAGEALRSAAAELAARSATSADLASKLIGSNAGPAIRGAEALDFVRSAVMSAIQRAEEKTTTSEQLVTQRDWLQEQLEAQERRNEILAADKSSLEKSLAAVANDRDAIGAERDALGAERDALGEEREALQSQIADLDARFAELATTNAATQAHLTQIVSTRAYRMVSAWWKLTGALRHGLGAMARAVLPTSWLATVRRMRRSSTLLPARNWYAYAFDRFKTERSRITGTGIQTVGSPGEPGLVSIVLPVFNGADMVRQSLDSIVAQTYERFEIIAINDGSTDETGEILDEYAERDDRVRVVHQENRKLPRTLSRGFRLARGEYLTWTSADNRCKPEFMQSLVDCLERHPDWDMVYANVDIIGDDGAPLHDSPWFAGYQVPPGSEHVHLPHDIADLNTYANNYVCAAFMYRSRVAWLLGDYSRHRFTTEDYDYWMRVNEMLRLRHADFDDSVYDYRFHATSLTARDEELGITSGRDRLMVFDDFRRDALLTPALWQIRSASEGARPVADRLTARIRSAGHLVFDGAPEQTDHWPTRFLTAISVSLVDDLAAATEPPPDDHAGTLRVLAVVDPDLDPTIDPHPDWDLCTVVGERPPGATVDPYRRWLSVANAESLFAAAEVRARSEEFRALEEVLFNASEPTVEATVVVCTHKIVEALSDSIQALVQQDADPETYEILLVNNRPSDQELASEVERLRHTGDVRRSELIRVVHCPIPGLSHARNAALSEAAGGIILCIDDDAVASTSLVSEAVRIFAERPHVGIIGGHIRLDPPDPPPPVLNPGWERYWSHFITGADECREVDQWWQFPWGACWCARRDVLIEMGGFRSRYGRVGNDFSGGEEIIAAALARRLGHAVAVAPELQVAHRVDSTRYSWRHVRNTIIAGTLVNYQAQRDLYLPMWESIGSTIKNLLSPSYDRTVGANSFSARARHWIYRKQAWIRLLRVQLGDRWRRMRPPGA